MRLGYACINITLERKVRGLQLMAMPRVREEPACAS